MLQTATLVVFAATFSIAINYFKDLTGGRGCRKLCSNCNILSFDEFLSQIGRLQVIFEPRFNLMAIRESSKAAAEVGGSDVLLKVVTPVMSLALNSCNRASSVTLFVSIKNIHRSPADNYISWSM